jgi:pimeloyl-ACP methyl ester carboxylesterase
LAARASRNGAAFRRAAGGKAMTAHNWVDRKLYPFESKWFDVDHKTIHYVDEGQGEPVVFVHGLPTWSFMYRDLILGLMPTCRCIAVDNLGFGLSQKPSAYTYRPEKMAEYLDALIRHLELENITFVLNGTGGPIGLSYVLDHPSNVRHLVLLNTFMWPLQGNKTAEKMARMADSGFYKWLHLKHNFGLRIIFKSRLKDRAHFNRDIHRHYLEPFPNPETRHAPLGYARSLLASGPWFQSLWDRRDGLKRVPAELLWGMQDDFCGADALERWLDIWPEAKVKRFKNNGHYLAEEQGAGLVPEVGLFLSDTDYLPTATVDI